MTYSERKAKWESMGMCCHCGGLRLDPAYKTCARCREQYKVSRNKKAYENFPDASGLQMPPIKRDHKCWSCEWANWLGDRFFCPFVEGTCVKEKK